jgi:hypothetical protein
MLDRDRQELNLEKSEHALYASLANRSEKPKAVGMDGNCRGYLEKGAPL